MGGDDSTQVTETHTTQHLDTTNIGVEDTEGTVIAAHGDVEFSPEITDHGAVQGAFDFAGEAASGAEDFGEAALDFASDIAQQAGQTSQQAVETSKQAIATVGTGGQSEITGQFADVFKWVAIGGLLIAGVMIFRSA